MINIDVKVGGYGWRNSLRDQMELNLTRKIPKGRTIMLQGNQLFDPLKYKKMPHIFFHVVCSSMILLDFSKR